MDQPPLDMLSRHARRPRQVTLRPTAMALLLCGALPVWAQEQGQEQVVTPPKPAFTVVPRVSVFQTFTNNIHLSDAQRRSEQVTEVSPGVRVTRDSGRLTGYLDYALRALGYAQGSHEGTYLHALSSAAELDALNRWLFVDFSGNVSQQSLTALGPLSASAGYSRTNSAEVSRYSLAPFVQGVLGGAVDYNARFSRTVTHAGSAASSDVGESRASLNLASASTLGRVGWVADASRYNVDYSAGRATEADQADIGLKLQVTQQLSAVVKVGREYSNYTSQSKQSHDSHDLVLAWQPSAQLQAQAAWGQRSFGNTHALSVDFHTPLVVLHVADRREVSAVPGALPPPLAAPVAALGPQVPTLGYFTTTAVALQRRQDLQVSLQGVRDTVTLGYSQSDYARLDTLAQSVDELSRSSVRQTLLSLDYTHRLTPLYTLDVLAGLQKTSAAPAQEDTLLRQLVLSLSGKVSRGGSASVSLRHAVSTGGAPYDETALSLGLQYEF
jgi:hypothetical protein